MHTHTRINSLPSRLGRLLSVLCLLGWAPLWSQRAYVANEGSNTVSVIDTSTNTVVSTVAVGFGPENVAITPNGQFAYVPNTGSGTVSVIDTSTNTVVSTVAVGAGRNTVAITPNGQFVYVPAGDSVSVIDTSTNTVVSTVAVGMYNVPMAVAITPNGQFAYVTNYGLENVNTVSVIDTSTNTVVSTVAVGAPDPYYSPTAVAITPNGQFAYVTNQGSGTVSVIDTSTNTVVSTVAVGNIPSAVAITPTVPFSSFTAQLQLLTGKLSGFSLEARFTLGQSSVGLHPLTEALTLTVGSYTVTLPAGSFQQVQVGPYSDYAYVGTINDVKLEMLILPLGGNNYAFQAAGTPVTLTGSTEAVPVTLTIGNNTGTTTVSATVIGH
jgi:YVTN family beta-propeller protein